MAHYSLNNNCPKNADPRNETCDCQSVWSEVFVVDKVSEGGIGQRQAMLMLKAAGIECKATRSPYIGTSGVEVTGTQKQMDQAEDILFG